MLFVLYLILLIGANIADNHPILCHRVDRSTPGTKARKLIVVDPRVTKTAMMADLHLAVKPRSDIALDGRKVVRVRLSGEHRPMTIGLATLKQIKKSRLLTAFANHARSFISDAYIPGMVPPAMGQKKR